MSVCSRFAVHCIAVGGVSVSCLAVSGVAVGGVAVYGVAVCGVAVNCVAVLVHHGVLLSLVSMTLWC